jgi:hypothetical protein
VNYIEEIKDVIRKLHGAEATHVETVPITESHEGQTVWEGEVEVFDLEGHPKTSRAYAWTHETDDPDKPRRTVTVLHVPPITSPRKAVQASIVQAFREAEANAES